MEAAMTAVVEKVASKVTAAREAQEEQVAARKAPVAARRDLARGPEAVYLDWD